MPRWRIGSLTIRGLALLRISRSRARLQSRRRSAGAAPSSGMIARGMNTSHVILGGLAPHLVFPLCINIKAHRKVRVRRMRARQNSNKIGMGEEGESRSQLASEPRRRKVPAMTALAAHLGLVQGKLSARFSAWPFCETSSSHGSANRPFETTVAASGNKLHQQHGRDLVD